MNEQENQFMSDLQKVRFFLPSEVVILVDQKSAMRPDQLQAGLLRILTRLEAPLPLKTALANRKLILKQAFNEEPSADPAEPFSTPWIPQRRIVPMGVAKTTDFQYEESIFQSVAHVVEPPTTAASAAAPQATDHPFDERQSLQCWAFKKSQENIEDEPEVDLSDIPTYFSLMIASLRGEDNQPISDEALIETLTQVNSRLPKDGEEDSESGVRLRGLVPNWLSASAQSQLVVGGPGAKPNKRTVSVTDIDWQFNLPDEFKSTPIVDHQGNGVTVVILDTVPEEDQFQKAFASHIEGKDMEERHPLLTRLLSPLSGKNESAQFQLKNSQTARLRVDRTQQTSAVMACPPEGSNEHNPEAYGILGHEYQMPDHGLFIAGIINSIAPAAKLRMTQILNCYGVGSLGTLADGLVQLLQDWPIGKVVVNCSSTFVLPQPEYRDTGREFLPLIPQWLWLELKLDEHPTLVTVTEDLIHRLFGVVRARGAAIVAAAGNEGSSGTHPQARMPASDPNVLGVGAVDKDDNLTGYTNRGDTPLSEGILTYGGGVKPDSSSDVMRSRGRNDGSNKGILGIYTQSLPDGQRSDVGWAYWAGTSFAAPIISAAIAIILGTRDGEETPTEKTPTDAIKFLRAIVEGQRAEDIFPVTQGP